MQIVLVGPTQGNENEGGTTELEIYPELNITMGQTGALVHAAMCMQHLPIQAVEVGTTWPLCPPRN